MSWCSKATGLIMPIIERRRPPFCTVPIQALTARMASARVAEFCRWEDSDFTPDQDPSCWELSKHLAASDRERYLELSGGQGQLR